MADKRFKISLLSDKFYNDYPQSRYSEIEKKPHRPYLVLLVDVDNNTFAIPFRSNIKHNYCYKFKNTSRETDSSTGLDFTKAVVLNDNTYIKCDASIDELEYRELENKFSTIYNRFKRYVQEYKKYINGDVNDNTNRMFRFTTLQYFNKELNNTISDSIQQTNENDELLDLTDLTEQSNGRK